MLLHKLDGSPLIFPPIFVFHAYRVFDDKGGILCDEMGLGKTAATLVLHLIHPAKTPSPGVPLDEKEWGSIGGHQVFIC